MLHQWLYLINFFSWAHRAVFYNLILSAQTLLWFHAGRRLAAMTSFINKTALNYKSSVDKERRYHDIHAWTKHSAKVLSEAKYLEIKPKGKNVIPLNEQFKHFNKGRNEDNKNGYFEMNAFIYTTWCLSHWHYQNSIVWFRKKELVFALLLSGASLFKPSNEEAMWADVLHELL